MAIDQGDTKVAAGTQPGGVTSLPRHQILEEILSEIVH
jgi:hypothetical protein